MSWAMMTTDEVAERLGVSNARVRQFVSENRLPAERDGRSLLFERSVVEEFATQQRRSGRPSTKSPSPDPKPTPAVVTTAPEVKPEAPAAGNGHGLRTENARLRQENEALRHELEQARMLVEALQAGIGSISKVADALRRSVSDGS